MKKLKIEQSDIFTYRLCIIGIRVYPENTRYQYVSFRDIKGDSLVLLMEALLRS